MKLLQKITLGSVRFYFRILPMISKKLAAEKAFQVFCTPQRIPIVTIDPIFDFAENLEFRFLDNDIKGYRWNKGGLKKGLIIHGFESTVLNFAAYVRPLIDKGYEVLAFDAPAHGRSSGKRINAIIYRDFLKQIQNEFGPIKSFVAHSFGGMAISLAVSELSHDESYRIVLIAPATETASAIDHFFRFIRLNNKEVKRLFAEIIQNLGGHPISWFSVSRAAPATKAKILWFHDEEDPITPFEDAFKVKEKNYPNIQFIFTKGLGHRRIYRDQKVIKASIDFL